MLLQEKLDKFADLSIPDYVHPLLHVNCKQAWIKKVKSLIRRREIKANMKTLYVLAKNWEVLLFNHYSKLN